MTTPAQDLRALVEALAIGMWCRGSGHELVKDELAIARRALEGDLRQPLAEAERLALRIASLACRLTMLELADDGLADIHPDVAEDLLARIPCRALAGDAAE
ncbi:MAG TPA: hypothetical protein VES39_01115, partial [Rhodospirillales bacterium]|nr:hypothetical protein [Rhodospirillales bacterium]